MRDRTFGASSDGVWIDNLDLPEETALAEPPRLTLVVGSGGCLVRVEGAPGTVNVLEASEDLRTWQPVASGVSTGPTLILSDPACGAGAARYYRVRVE